MNPVLPATTTATTTAVQKRIAKKARATPQLVDTVREVVKAFEFEYAQVRAESVQLKSVLDDRRTQLSDLRRHLEKESSKSGALEAVVQHRSSKNDKGVARLSALERDFNVIVDDDRVISSRATAFESDLGVITQEHRRIREMVSSVAAQLDRAQAALDERERVLDATARETERLGKEVEEGRRAVEDKQCLLRSKQQKAAAKKVFAKEKAAELEDLDEKTSRLREEVSAKATENEAVVLKLGGIQMMASEVGAHVRR